MSNNITVHYENKPAYDIMIQPDFTGLAQAIRSLKLEGRRFMVVSDSNVAKHYLEEIINSLKTVSTTVESFVFPAGENSKNLSTVNDCYERLIKAGFDRKDVLVALGGGVVGDLTGFAAATYLRGIRFLQIPTSLLSMVDSSIGGKTGVDFKAYKNMVGAFHQPKLVYMNISALNSLPEKEFTSGMGEVIKHGLIKDREFYLWLQKNSGAILAKQYSILAEMIYRSCQIKKEVVEKDPKEQGERALLNFGHTIGHSVEKLKNFSLLHGECVCIGMAAAAFISQKRGYLDAEQYQNILKTIENFKQPLKAGNISAEEVLEATKLDKKMDAGQIRFILLKEIGNAVIDTSVTMDEMLSAIATILD